VLAEPHREVGKDQEVGQEVQVEQAKEVRVEQAVVSVPASLRLNRHRPKLRHNLNLQAHQLTNLEAGEANPQKER